MMIMLHMLSVLGSRRLLAPLALAFLLCGCAAGKLRPDEQQRMAGKTVVITGASSGIGRGVALELAAMRANVVLLARRQAVLDALARQITAAGGTALVAAGDVSRPEDLQRAADQALARFGRIDVWINNAGVGALGRFEEIPIEDHARIIDVNLKGVIYGSHVALREFVRQGDGVLINIGSMESEVPIAYQSSYAASKAAVLSLGRSLAEELRLAGLDRVRVATVMPWATDTPFFTHAANYSGGTPRMVLMDDAQKPVDVIVRTALYPREEVSVGWKARSAYFGHRVASDLTEHLSGSASDKLQLDVAPLAPATSGNLHQPMQAGSTVDGGMRARMAQEDAAMEKAREGRR
jgi:short-subunit dehydrogenase